MAKAPGTKPSAAKTRKKTDASAAPPPPMAAAPAHGLVPSSVDEPTVELDAPRTHTEDDAVTVRFGPIGGDAEARKARAHVVLAQGARLKVHYDRDASDLGQGGEVVRIEMGYQFEGAGAGMSVVADGQRSAQGVLVRRAPVIRIPPGTTGELHVWFRLDTTDGRTLWDSAFSRNYRFPLAP